jgi:curved DNA-binding protein CbpA
VKRLAEQTLYEILEVPPGAAFAEIERACERAATLFGPGSIVTYTHMTTEEASQISARIEEARRTLLDEAARARYDEALGIAPPRPVARAEGPATPEPGTSREAEASPANVPAPGALAAAQAPPSPVSPAAPEAVPGGSPLPLTAVAPPAAPPSAPSPIPLEVEAGPAVERDVVVAENAAWSGEVLRRVREARGLSVQQISERTRVVRHHIENIEADRFGLLPAPVYLRGILQTLARELRLDGQKVARSYLERVQASSQPPAQPPPRSR